MVSSCTSRHIVLVCTASVAVACATAARAAPSEAAHTAHVERIQQLLTPAEGQPVSFPGANQREIALSHGEAVNASTAERGRLSFEVRMTGSPKSPVRLLFHVQNKQGWFYQTAMLWAVPVGRWRRVDVDFSPESDAWESAGHGRPWNATSARALTRLGIRLFCETTCSAVFHLRNPRWEPTGRAPSDAGLGVVDLREPRGTLHAGELWELSFRTSRPVNDPFDPGVADFVCEVVTPDGEREANNCFIYQDFVERDGELVAVGAPQWRVRYRPMSEGRYRYRLTLTFATPGDSGLAAEGWFTVTGRPSPPLKSTVGRDDVSDMDGFLLDLSRNDGGWRPELAAMAAVWRNVGFQRDLAPSPRYVWRAMLEWTKQWGQWEGLGVYDLAIAWQLDRILAKAAESGVTAPFALLDDGPFLDHGTFRWPVNPLCAEEGGPLAGPGEFFSNQAAQDLFVRRMRYVIARHGHSPAVASWCLAVGLAAPGAAEWHERVGRAALSCGVGEPHAKPLIALHPFAAPFRGEVNLGEFEKGRPAGWRHDAKDSPGAAVRRSKGAAGSGDALAISFPTARDQEAATTSHEASTLPKSAPDVQPFPHATVVRSLDDNLFGYDYLTFDVHMPRDAQNVGRAQVIVRDRDLLWYEYLLETPLRPGDWTRCIVDLSTTAGRFRPVNHKRSWSGYTRARIRSIAVRLFPNGTAPGPVLLDHVRLYSKPRQTQRPLAINVINPGPTRVGRYDKHELTLQLNQEFANPFDPDEIALEGVYTHVATGRKHTVPGFFYEPYTRGIQHKRVNEFQGAKDKRNRPIEVEVDREVEVLHVAGAPDWRIRFSPVDEGEYSVTVRARTREQTKETPGPSFECVASKRKGFVRVAKDNQYFEHTSGEMFYPIGPVIRSPNDVRDMGRDGAIRNAVLKSGWRGTYQFDEYLAAMEKSGANWIRMWMCSWWCGLEWYHEWPGYSGTGRYNMPNAWRLDHVLERAHEAGVYIQLCLENHGQTSIRIDHEWEYHPYNRYLPEAYDTKDAKDKELRVRPDRANDKRYFRPGGWLMHPADFYHDRKAIQARQKLFRYIIARWGYSPNILAWVLSSELDFTGEYWRVQYGHDDREKKQNVWNQKGVDRSVHTQNWHRIMVKYLRETDQARHMVTTHFSHPIRGRGVWRIKELSYTQSNAYSAFRQANWFTSRVAGPGGCAPAPMAMSQYYDKYMGAYGRPVLVVEWGGHWMHNPKDFLDAELHTGTWASLMTPMAGSTGFWWWSHIHFNDRYGVYTAAKRFLEGEDRRGLGLRSIRAAFTPHPAGLDAVTLGDGTPGKPDGTRADVYVYHVGHARKLGSGGRVEGITLEIPDMERGRYLVETWDTTAGKPIRTEAAFAVAGVLRFELPAIQGDLALKIRPVK